MSRIRLALSIAVLPASLIGLAWGVWPQARKRVSLEVAPSAMALPTSPTPVPRQLSTPDLSRPSGDGATLEPTQPLPIGSGGTASAQSATAPQSSVAAIPETRRLSLEYPAWMRSADSDTVRLDLALDAAGEVTAMGAGGAATGQPVQIPDVYDAHNVIAEAQLDVPGIEIRPSESVSEPLLPGQTVSFFWSVHATEAGTYDGTAWLFLIFVDKTTGVRSRIAISAQSVHITATNFLGLRGDAARGLGGIGSLLGGLLGFPFVEMMLRWSWRVIRRRF